MTVAVATVVLLLVGFVLWNYFSPRSDPRIEAIRKAGYPVTLAELDAWYLAVPDAENAALVYTNAFAQLAPKGDDDGTPSLGSRLDDISLPARGQVLSNEDKTEISSLLATYRAALRLLYSAQALDRSRYPIDLKKGHSAILPHLGGVKRAVQLLAAESLLHTAEGRAEQAAQSLVAAGHAADSLAEEPQLISQAVSFACWGIIVPHLEHLINAINLTDEQLVSLQTMLTEAEQPRAGARALAGERVVGTAIFADFRLLLRLLQLGEGEGEIDTKERIRWAATFSLLKATGHFQKDKAFYLDVIATNIATAELTYPERFKLGQQAAAMMQTTPSRFYFVSRVMLPGLARTFAKDADHAARIRVAQTALAVERFRRAHGESLPASLDELVPTYLKAIPLDPIDGQQLRFKKLAKGYVIYSIGSDGQDDGGAEPDPKNRNAPSDITFIMER
jgi:hypothetical protein